MKRCPRCFGRDIRPSLPRGLVDKIMKTLGRKPYRCRGCGKRFHLGEPKDDLDQDLEMDDDTPEGSSKAVSEESRENDVPKPAEP